jgi:hypothetical protein
MKPLAPVINALVLSSRINLRFLSSAAIFDMKKYHAYSTVAQ